MTASTPSLPYQVPLFRTTQQLQAAWSLEVKICALSVALNSDQPIWEPVASDMFCESDAESRRLFIVRECGRTGMMSTELIGEKGEVRSIHEKSPDASHMIYWKNFRMPGGSRWLPIPTWAWQQSPWRPELAERGSAEHGRYLLSLSQKLRALADEASQAVGG